MSLQYKRKINNKAFAKNSSAIHMCNKKVVTAIKRNAFSFSIFFIKCGNYLIITPYQL